jgi:predicted dienelactone hydrolase
MPSPPRFLLLAATAATVLASLPAAAGPVGFSLVHIPDGTDPPIEAGIWYPTSATPQPTHIETFVQDVAPDSPAAAGALPLVVMSHGHGGSYGSHADTSLALAQAGIVAASLTHGGDNYRDESRDTDLHHRVHQLHVLASWMLHGWHRGTIDPARVGAFGFSAGGFTVLALAGGNPNLSLVRPFCQAHPAEFTCRLVGAHKMEATDAASLPFEHDPGLRAIVVAAPAVGFTFAGGGLSAVTMPVQLWQAKDDQILPSPDYVEPVAAALPTPPQWHVVPHAGHFDFLAPCWAMLARIAPPICVSKPGFDRAAFHADLDAEVVRFFRAKL